MRSIRLYMLKFKLSAIFKEAGQLVRQGVERGDQRYRDLAEEAVKLMGQFNGKTDKPLSMSEFKSYDDLCELCIPTPKPNPAGTGLIVVGVFGVIMVSFALLGAVITECYHGFIYLFHLIGL